MTIVFTAILGGSDRLKPAPRGADRCVCFVTDRADYPEPHGWELIEVVLKDGEDPRRAAWYLRAVPHEWFQGYSRVVWIDASFTLTDLQRLLADAGAAPIAALRHHTRRSCYAEGQTLVHVKQARPQDIVRQLGVYRKAGFVSRHLSISCMIVRDASDTARLFNDTWRREIDLHPGDNTQVSLDYAAWMHGTEITALTGTRHENPYSVHDHLDHKRRRRPYVVPA